MKNTKKKMLFLVAMLWILSLFASSFELNERLPMDDKIIHGTMENGLTYYIRQNSEPRNIAEFRLALKVGSIHEDEDQFGVAHFVEHLAFAGSENFPSDSLNLYMDSIGFGFMSGGFNAGTSLNYTYYLLRSLVDDKEQLETATLILSDWAAQLTFEPEMIEKERGIILEEMRDGLGAMDRMFDHLFAALFEGSRYATQFPIGTQEVLENVSRQRIKDFYTDWYRPDLMAVVAVGDFDPMEIRALIYKYFEGLPAPENPRPIPDFTVPSHTETRFSLVTDSEFDRTFLAIRHKTPYFQIETISDYRREMINTLLDVLMSVRFEQISMQPDSPFVYAFTDYSRMFHELPIFHVASLLDETSILDTFTYLVTEIERAKRHGFHESELFRAKAELYSMQQSAFLERDSNPSSDIADGYAMSFVDYEPILDEAYEFELVAFLLDTIDMQDIMEAVEINFSEENRVVTLYTPGAIGFEMPTEEAFLTIFETVKETELEMFPEIVLNEPLMQKAPRRVRVNKRNRSYDDETGLYTWQLRNGATVYLKPTDFRNNEIRYEIFRTGGLSQAGDEIYHSAYVAYEIMSESGLGALDHTQLRLYLAGKDVEFNTLIARTFENIYGYSSVQDFETMLQMTWQTFKNPRFDDTAFQTWKHRKEINTRNQQNDPNFFFHHDAINSLLYDNHFRMQNITVEDIQEICHQTAFDFYKSRFDSANGFHFIFVGNINPDDLHSFIERYIATLPKKRVNTQIIDRGIRFNQMSTEKDIFRGQDDRTVIRLVFTNDTPPLNMRENYAILGMSTILSQMLMDNVRERMSGVYYIHAYPKMETFPFSQIALNIMLGCDPQRVDEIIEEINVQIDHLLQNTFDDSYINTTRETFRQNLEIEMRTNDWWVSQLLEGMQNDWDLRGFMSLQEMIDDFTREEIVEMARRYIDPEKRLKIVLYPEGFEK